MKTTTVPLALSPRSQRGSAVLVLLAFLGIMLVLCSATTRAVMSTRNEVALLEKQQLARLAASTHAPPTSKSLTAP
jgi:hypothetical protein